MNRFSRWFQVTTIGILAQALGANDLWAAGSGKGISGEVFWQIISFVLLSILLAQVLKKPVRSFLGQRQEEIKNSIEQAARKETESQSQLEAWERKLSVLSQEVVDLHQRISQEGEAERKRIIEHATEEGERIRKQALGVAEQEVKKARAALKKDMVDLSLEFAEKLLQETTQPQDQERLVKEFIGKMGEIR
ncbi:MAG: F0F1 ATP synthase subunit B [Pseudomonadota bacterium]